MLVKKLSEEDFRVLRGPLESGRQSPDSLAFALILTLFLQPLAFYLTYAVAGEVTIYPNKDRIFTLHLWITGILVLMSAVYIIPFIYRRSQKIQYLLTILASQNIAGVCFYLCALFIIGEADGITEGALLNFTYITLLLGLLIFIATSIRFYILLQKGHYRKGSKKDELRERFETTSYLPTVIIGSTGLVYILQYLVRHIGFSDFDGVMIILIGAFLFFAMIFVLPEQLVILYCKIRFDSFNYNKRGRLNSVKKKSL